ncbi:MAG: hypothetical protein Q7S58_16695 [Candidatus Binatus sp.]|uniref:hypothetical protein n=1 Tax=Candidatus Binatus sp. TaxID=2811406 RepID=UPI0027170FD8|nr:hypothetical protein [Candidatus Binatus sp.]MDO8434038.1 hypothetical protein [Candidatus Binatus sp.]
MPAGEEISRIESEIDDARRDLHETMAQVHQKVEIVESELRPGHKMIQAYPLAALGVGAVLGFLIGNKTHRPTLGPVILGLICGYGAVKAYSMASEKADGKP